MLLTILSAFAADPGALTGTWVYAGGEPEKTKRTEAIEAVAQTFNFAIRGIARGRLKKVACHDQTIDIRGTDGNIQLVFTGDNPRTSVGPWTGEAVDVRGANVSFVPTPDKKLVVTGETGDGGKRSTYTLTSPDTMTASYEVWSGMLDGPLKWELSYKRQ